MGYRIEKTLNNNVAVVTDEKNIETIVMGRGIAFQKKPGDAVPAKAVEKFFVLKGKELNSKFQSLLINTPMEYILVSEAIIKHSEKTIDKKFSESIYVTLTDHIAAAVQRYAEGITLHNALLMEIRQFYPEEFELGQQAVNMLRASLGVHFSDDEAGFIALHFVNAQLDSGITMMYSITRLIQEVLDIVSTCLPADYDKNALSTYRFTNHLKFFAQRLFSYKLYNEDSCLLSESLQKQKPEAYACACRIADFIKKQYACDIGQEEIAYKAVHIARMMQDVHVQNK